MIFIFKYSYIIYIYIILIYIRYYFRRVITDFFQIQTNEFILNNYYQVKTKYMNQSIKDEKVVYEFFEQLNGDFIQNLMKVNLQIKY